MKMIMEIQKYFFVYVVRHHLYSSMYKKYKIPY